MQITRMKNIPKPTLITIVIAILLFVIMPKDDFFMLWLLIFLFSFLISWLAPKIFYPIFAHKLSKGLLRTVLGLLTVACFVLFGITTNMITDNEQKIKKDTANIASQKSETLITKAESYINDNNIEQATVVLLEAKKLDPRNSNVSTLQRDINRLQDSDEIKKILTKMSDDDFNLLIDNKLLTEFLVNKKLNELFIKELQNDGNARKDYVIEAEQKRKEAEKENQEKADEEERLKRESTLESQFSAWDGSHRNLSRMIKDSMNDPKSYDHVETRYFDMEDHLVVITTFRGSNAFGALIKNTVKAKVSLEGDVLEIIEQF
jgi:hypothetical protein